jgi:5-formyltetrahydrofolate cyclo-ligase
LKFEQMLEDHKKLLYPTCEDGQKKLYMLARTPSSNILTYQAYEINGNTFYAIAR